MPLTLFTIWAALAAAAGSWNPFSLNRLIFFPEPMVASPPPGVDERWIVTEDGIRLHAWYAGAQRPAPTLIWSHGNAGNIAGRVDVALALAGRGINVLAYDYRGYGKSKGYPSEEGLYLDARAAYGHLRSSGVEQGSIVCFGESLGGAVSIQLATQRPCAGVAVVSTFTRMRDVASYHYGPLGALAGRRFDSLSRLGEVDCPVFIAHGESDEVVPYRLGVELYQAAKEPKRFFPVPAAHHNDIFLSTALVAAIAEFVIDVTGG